MSEWVIYHNPRCSKSRAALKYLQERGIQPRVVEYLKTPPDAATLRELLRRLGISARELLRTNEKEYRALGLDRPDLSEEEVIEAMVQHPILIQRPIVLRGDRAVLGRPTEAIQRLFED